MIQIELQLAILWIALMLVFLLGDVIRLFSGDTKPGEIMGKKMSQPVWLGISILMVTPILMILASIFLSQPINRPLNIIVAGLWFLFNLMGLPSYPSAYDRFLLLVSMVINVITIVIAWNWAA
jgi:hypothetical protein